jgi:hypothetical protein
MVRDCGSPLGGPVGGTRASEVTNGDERGVGGITRTGTEGGAYELLTERVHHCCCEMGVLVTG